MRTLALALSLFCLTACRRDPLAEHRVVCKKLQEDKSLRAGLTVDQCTQELKARADLADPGRRAEELIQRIARLLVEGRDKPTRSELRDALGDLKDLGRPAEGPALARLGTSEDPELRIALARVLVGICATDCAAGRYQCIVPALLEGTGRDRPPEVRVESEKALSRCTREQLGDDPAAWRAWWSAKQAELPGATAAAR